MIRAHGRGTCCWRVFSRDAPLDSIRKAEPAPCRRGSPWHPPGRSLSKAWDAVLFSTVEGTPWVLTAAMEAALEPRPAVLCASGRRPGRASGWPRGHRKVWEGDSRQAQGLCKQELQASSRFIDGEGALQRPRVISLEAIGVTPKSSLLSNPLRVCMKTPGLFLRVPPPSVPRIEHKQSSSCWLLQGQV